MTSQPPEPDPTVRLGEIVDDRYRIVAHLGTGGMAIVYRAEHVHTRAPVAIKVLHREFGDNEEVAARFRREVMASRRIQHPSVVAAMDLGRLPDGSLYMVLEYIQGEDLFTLLTRESPLAQLRAVKIALQVAQALVAAHAAGVIHRDLKPDNIMLVQRGADREFVKVVDFGIAKVTLPRAKALTAVGSIFGTPEYMAPEQARGATVDHRTDLYALGIVLYQMLAGQTPFSNDQPARVLFDQISTQPPALPATIDGELSHLVAQLLAKQPADRVQSAHELVERLGSIAGRLEAAGDSLSAQGASLAPIHPLGASELQAPREQSLPAADLGGRAPSNGVLPDASAGGAQRQTSWWVGCLIAVIVLSIIAFIMTRVISAIF